MKILVLGSDGFIGRQVRTGFTLAGHDVFANSAEAVSVNLLKPDTIAQALRLVKPEVVINTAGIVENSVRAASNVTFTTNLLEAAAGSGLTFRRLITTGSASEYGIVSPNEVPVDEDVPLRADSHYGRSKIDEGRVALRFREEHHLPVVIARLFNPLGAGMHPRMLIPNLVRQIREIETGERAAIEISRLDAARDYINVREIATAYLSLVDGDPRHAVYNIGSGRSTTNSELIQLILDNTELATEPAIVETSGQPEPLFAGQADITRISNELGWRPKIGLEQTMKEILDDERRRGQNQNRDRRRRQGRRTIV
jgi:nucleoside-diphosphate-sugar epimerase